jgi:subtilisin family serine protease
VLSGLSIAAIAAIVVVAGQTLVAAAPADPGRTERTAVYLVQTAGAPIASYTGGVSDIPATMPTSGGKVQPRTWNYRAYQRHLTTAHGAVLRGAGVDPKKKLTEYSTVFNGFAAELTAAEAARISHTSGVVKIFKNELQTTQTVTTPRFLGLDGPAGAWQQQFGDVSHAGEGVIVGVIDQGIWPEHPSFAALPEPRPDQAVIDSKWSGTCQTGEDHPVACNNKLIGARYYDATNLPKFAGEFRSPRDYGGHGSSTASTAVGNHGVPAGVNGVELGPISGMAPAARLAMYKAVWQAPNGTGGTATTVDLVHAVDDAVADGVDVINFSLAGGSTLDPVEIAFLNATAAGVFVAASAGNGGVTSPTFGTIHSYPWDTTVAASTHDRSFSTTVTLGNGLSFSGAGIGPAVGPLPFVDAANAAAAGRSADEAAACATGALDPAVVAGKAVLCKRGNGDRPPQSRAVRDAGGLAVVLYNPTPDTVDADIHVVPTIHVDHVAGRAIKAYLAATANPTAALGAATRVAVRAPEMSPISSPGPARAGGGDLLKPDITAPGVDVFTASSPASDGKLFGSFTGTSLSSPHIAGIAALLRSRNPAWSPMAVKSALMTTASQLDNTGQPIQRGGAPATPLDFGAGHVRPGSAFDPGLVYESGPTDWLRYACGIGEHLPLSDGDGGTVDACTVVGSIDPSDLNYPSIAVGDLIGRQVIRRTVTNVTGQASVYLARPQAPPGFTVNVTPSTLVVRPHQSASYQVEITRTDAAYGRWAFGSLSWSDLRGHNVRSPIAVRPIAVAAPAALVRSTTAGSADLAVRAGFRGTLTATAFGLAPSTVTTQHLVGALTTFNRANPAAGPAVGKVTVTVPAGTKLARFATFAADVLPETDIDMFVYQAGTANLVGASSGNTAEEAVTVSAAGVYDVYLVQFALPAGATEQDVRLHTFLVGAAPTGNLTVAPASRPVTPGAAATVTVTWHDLSPGRRYFGVVEYGDGSTVLGQTIVAVDT